MSLDIYVHGLRPVTEEYKKKLKIYKACNELNIKPPEELLDYFDYENHPCEDGIVIDIPKDLIKHSTSVEHCSDYYDVDLAKLPKDVSKIRFEISY